MKYLSRSYRNRFPSDVHVARQKVWQVLCREVFQNYIRSTDTVMDIGAGYCDFINAITCKQKIAVDLNPDTKNMAAIGVKVLPINALAISRAYEHSIDVIFMSNFLEHLPNKDILVQVLEKSRRLLKPHGTLMILQPNITLVKERYWDFIDHHIALNKNSIDEALQVTGFERTEYVHRFLPYTTKGGLPMWSWIVWLYLRIPSALRPFAGQSLFIARAR